jgi:hypothetical protein
MFNKEITSSHTLAIWLIAAILLTNTIMLFAGGYLLIKLERMQMRTDLSLCALSEPKLEQPYIR